MLTDASGLVLALIAASLATRAATIRRTYGWQRAEVLAALANALLLVGIGVWVLIKAIDRLRSPGEVETGLMLIIAVVGALANTAGLLILRRGQAESLNVRGAYLEVLGDLLGSVAVIVAAILIMLTGWYQVRRRCLVVDLRADRAAGLVAAARRGRRVVGGDAARVDLVAVREHIRGVTGVVDVHDLHAWTITSGVPVLSAHVVVDEACISEGRSARCSTGWPNAWVGTSTWSTARFSWSRSAIRARGPAPRLRRLAGRRRPTPTMRG
jgi:cobalt-zinc-cadmium efflux system protein